MNTVLNKITYQEHISILNHVQDYDKRVPEMLSQNLWFRVVDYDCITRFSKKHKKRWGDTIQSIKISYSRFVIVFIETVENPAKPKLEMKPMFVFVETVTNKPEEINSAIEDFLK